MDAIEMERAKDWIEEFGFWNPGAPVLRPSMLTYPRKENRTREIAALTVGRIVERAKQLNIPLPFGQGAKTAIMEVGENGMFPHVAD